jgi:hypothetical protein
MTSHVDPPSSCCLSCSCGPVPFRPRVRGDFGDGATKRVLNLVVLTGSSVKDVGSGADSIKVIFSRGRVARSEEGRSAGEHASIKWRRWVLVV